MILGNILTRTIDIFKGMTAAKVAELIEGEVQVAKVPVDSGLTNAETDTDPKTGKRIVGMNTESSVVNEGTVRYDLIFYVRTPKRYGRKGRLAKVIVNIEMQKSNPSGYKIINRGIYYACRMVSSQNERDFENSNYDDIQNVYSIWIVMGMEECSINHIHLTNEYVQNHKDWGGNLDALNVVLIGMTNAMPEQKEQEHEIYRLLGALFSQGLSLDDRMKILEDEFDVEESEKMRKGMTNMCNLSDGIEERAKRSATADAERRFIINMHEEGDSDEKIARVVGKSISDVQAVLADTQPVMA